MLATMLCILCLGAPATTPSDALAALDALDRDLPGFEVIDLEARRGSVRLDPDMALTIDDLRGYTIDPDPPTMTSPPPAYAPEQSSGFAEGEGPYVAPGIAPFRLRELTAQFSYTGWHNLDMMDYAVTHGFDTAAPYVMQDTSHWPAGTKVLKWGSFVKWREYFEKHGIPWGRYDLLAERDVLADIEASGEVWPYQEGWIAMLDLEHGGPLSPEDLRTRDWYPRSASRRDRAAFETKYYQGYLLTYTAPMEALHRAGWDSVGVYPQAYGTGWWALVKLDQQRESGIPDPGSYWPWRRYGRTLYRAQDVLYPSLYWYYWSAANVAYSLARIDFDRALIGSEAARRPYCPYYWPLLHGGNAEDRWWKDQPEPTEDIRAQYVLSFLAGCDGVVLWNWSGKGSHQVPPPLWREDLGYGEDVMVGTPFEINPEGARATDAPVRIRRYDVLPVVELLPESDEVRFQRIDTSASRLPNDRLQPGAPVFRMKRADLVSHLRPDAEAVTGAVEGLAIVKVLEGFIAVAEPIVDVPALRQFIDQTPIVRRMRLGGVDLIATYDPRCVVSREAPRTVTLADFGGVPGRDLVLPADGDVRIYAVREVAGP